MAPKDFVTINWNYFSSIAMNNEREEEDEIDLTIVQHVSSIDSLEQNESTIEGLRFISGCHKWINTNNNIRVEHSHVSNDNDNNLISEKNFSIINKNNYEINQIEDINNNNNNLDQTDLSLNHFDVQLQVNNGQLQPAIRYEVFSSIFSEDINRFKINQYSQTIETEMDMDHGNNRKNGNYNGYSQQNNGNNNTNNNSSYQRNSQTNGSSGNGGSNSADGNGSNPNRNNNNSRRPNDNDSEDNDDNDDDDDDDDEDDDNETDENLARRLNFRLINNETIRIIGHLRTLTNKKSFDRRDFENFQYLIDELIRLQHLENSSQEHLENIIHYLKFHRILRTKSQALKFIQERLPQRNIRSNNENNSNVFNVWRERERRARLDSKDSLEEEGQNSNGQQLRDITEINHPTPPIILTTNTNGTTKVKRMAKHIDTKSISSHTGDHPRSSSPSPTNFHRNSNNYSNEKVLDDRLRIRKTLSPISLSEQHRVREMIDRLESSSTASSNKKTTKNISTKKISTKKTFHDDYSDGSTSFTSSSSPVKRTTRGDIHENNLTNKTNENFIFRHRSPDEDIFFQTDASNATRFELDREVITNGGQRTTKGPHMDDYVTRLHPDAETSISMVRDVRARLYEDHSALSRTDVEDIPVKFDVETLYILEQKTDKKSVSPVVTIHRPTHEYNRPSISERNDFAMQTTIPISTIKPSNRPIGTQVGSTVEHHTVSAQTTDSLHRRHKERQRLPSPSIEDDESSKVIQRTTTTVTKIEKKRRHSSHTSEDEDNGGGGETFIYIDDKENFQVRRQSLTDDQIENISEQYSSFDQVTSHIHTDEKRDINRQAARRHLEQYNYSEDEYRSSEIYEIHTRGACKCLVVSYEEKTQYGPETRFEKQLKRIERTYTDEELRATELHVIVTTSDENYQLVRRDYGSYISDDDDIYNKSRQPIITIHYYTKEGHRMRTEQARHLEHLPVFIRCEIEYELNHYGSAQLVILSVTSTERRQMNVSVKKETVDDAVSRTSDRFAPDSPELENEISQKLAERISLLHLVDYSSRDDYNQTNSTDLRRVSRVDVSTSLCIVQRYRTIIHRLCQLYRSHLRLTSQAEQQRHLILVSGNEYYLLDLATQTPIITTNTSDFQQRKREIHTVPHQPFDYAKYRRDMEQQQRILEQHYRQTQDVHPSGHPTEPEFYLGAGRRALIEREIHSMRESIRPHEHAPPRYKHEPARRSLSISYSGGPRYVRARIIHVKDYFDESQQRQPPSQAKEQELFVRVDDFINESAANSLRRSYSTDYLQEDGPRSRIRYIRIPGETIRIEEKTTYEYQGVMYADLPYSLKYWNILSILDREARDGRPLGSTLPHVIVNDPYQTVIPPLTQQEIHQTAQQILSPQHPPRSYTDQTLHWFLSRDNRTKIEPTNYLPISNLYHQEQIQQQQLEEQLRQEQLRQQQLQDQQYQQQLEEQLRQQQLEEQQRYQQQIQQQQLEEQLRLQKLEEQLRLQQLEEQLRLQQLEEQLRLQQLEEQRYQQQQLEGQLHQQQLEEQRYQQQIQQQQLDEQLHQQQFQEQLYQQQLQEQFHQQQFPEQVYEQQIQEQQYQQQFQEQQYRQQLEEQLRQQQLQEQLCQQQLQEQLRQAQLKEQHCQQRLQDQLRQQQFQTQTCQQQLQEQRRQQQLQEQLCQKKLQEQLRQQQLQTQICQQQLQEQLRQQQLQEQHCQQRLQEQRRQQQFQQQQRQQHQYQQEQQQRQQERRQTNIMAGEGGKTGVAKKYYVVEKLVRYEKMPDRLIPVAINDRAQSIDNIDHRSQSTSQRVQQSFHSQTQLNRSQSQPRPQYQHPKSTHTPNFRAQLPSMHSPISRHQSVHNLHSASTLSHPPSPSPSLHSLHSNHNHNHHQHHRRPVAFNNRFQPRPTLQQQDNPLLTEIIDSQTGERILTTSHEKLPTEVLGLLNKYNLQ